MLKQLKQKRVLESTEKILKQYHSQNIKIPFDIIEELDYQTYTEPCDIIEFIESQRYNWKLENQKKFKPPTIK